MVDNKIKVLQINIGNNLGGVSSLIYNIYLNINKRQVNLVMRYIKMKSKK